MGLRGAGKNILGRNRRFKGRVKSCAHLEGVVTFYGSHHALRAEKSLQEAGYEAVLIPGPREISPNCGVALRFLWEKEDECKQVLEDSSVQYEALHHYPEEG